MSTAPDPDRPRTPSADVPAWGTPPARLGEPTHPHDPAWSSYPESSQAVLAFVLGIIGLFVFQLVAPAAWVIGRQEVRAVDEGRRDPRNRGLAQAGQVMGIIGTVLVALAVVAVVVLLVTFVAASTSVVTR